MKTHGKCVFSSTEVVVYLKNNGISDEICDKFDRKTIIVNYRNKYDT